MKHAAILVPSHTEEMLFSPARDNCTEPYIRLRSRLADFGYEATAYLRPDTELVVMWDYQAAEFSACERLGVMPLLVIGEPAVIFPYNHDPETHAKFETILTWDDRLVDGKKFHRLCWPQPVEFPEPTQVPFHRRKLLVNISCNKMATGKLAQYAERVDTIQWFRWHMASQFDLYGIGWDSARPVDHKWNTFPHYRFGLAYENMKDQPGYVTEKIFDIMRSGTVPVYWGAPNIRDYVDEGCFVDRTQFRSIREMALYLRSMKEPEWEDYRQAIRSYLKTDKFKRFLSGTFVEQVVQLTGVSQAVAA